VLSIDRMDGRIHLFFSRVICRGRCCLILFFLIRGSFTGSYKKDGTLHMEM